MIRYRLLKQLFAPIVCIALLSLSGCKPKERPPDVSHIQIDLQIDRYDQELMSLDTATINEGHTALAEAYPNFHELYLRDIMGFCAPKDTILKCTQMLKGFLVNPYILGLEDTINHRFPDVSELEADLSQAFKYFKYYFPEHETPKEVVTFFSEFAYGAITFDSLGLGIGLDMYLGANYVFYEEFFPVYFMPRLQKDYIVANCMEVWYRQYYDDPGQDTRYLILEMIEQGKLYYYLDKVLPETPDHLKIGFTEDQYRWCELSEGSIWQFFSDHDLFYNDELMEVRRYLTPGPSTPGMPPESPGNVGGFVGWQIVRSYMKQAKGSVSLEQLLETDAELILSKSKYRPKY